MKTLRVSFLIVTSAWTALACAADSTERTYADPACSARDVSPERCVLQNGNPRRIVVGSQNAAAASARSGTPTAAAPAAPNTGTSSGQGAASATGGLK